MSVDPSHLISMFENATEGFVITDHQGNIFLINPSACRMFQYQPEELIGQPVEILIPKVYAKEHVHLRGSFYEHPKNRVMGHGRDLKGQRKSGETFPVEVSLSTYILEDERYVTAFIVDITHRKEIEQHLLHQKEALEKVTEKVRRLNAELELKVEERTLILKEALRRLEQSQQELSEALDKERQLNEIKSRFVSMASHEFRTPLSTILSSASLLSRYTATEDQEKRMRHVEKIRSSVKQLNDLLEDFLSLGKLEEGKTHVHWELLNIHDLVLDTVEEMKGLVKNDQEIRYAHHGVDTVYSDKKLIKNILINLLSNAIKFSNESSIIEVVSQMEGNTGMITVRDYGIGISDEDQQHLFSSFFRGKNALNIQGTGLGLHIIKRYLDLLGGTTSVSSQLNKGTTITLTFPINQH
jgi:PAS domain S-box-containing protein